MRCEATFLEKTIFKKCYVTDGNISLMGLDWIDELNLIQFPDENETCRTLTFEPTNVENLEGGRKRCLHVAEIPHPSIRIQSPKPDSARTQVEQDNQNFDLGVKVPRRLSSHSWSVADSPSKVLLAVTLKNKKLDVKRSRRELEPGVEP
ncbi:hypothetical protein ACTXT7_003932 [Hymenolepis weldensis]